MLRVLPPNFMWLVIFILSSLTLISGLAFNYTAFKIMAGFGTNMEGGVDAGIFAVVAFSLGYYEDRQATRGHKANQ